MILCCGEALIDMVPIEGGLAPLAGGAIFNTAIALGRLGVKTQFLSGLSTDLFGEQLVETLAQSHVDASPSVRSNRPTTLAFVKLTDGHAQYTFYDENTAGRMMTTADIGAIHADVSALYFGGISLISEPAADAYAGLAAREARARVVMIDPNIRPSFVTNETAYRTRITKMIALADIVKVSDEDLDWILPGSDTIEAKLAAIKATGPSIAILTKGSKGAMALFGDGQTVEVMSQKVEVRDTVGAGDTFNAGVLAQLHASEVLTKPALRDIPAETLKQALAYGAKVAAITVSRDGANPPWAKELV